MYSTFLFQNNPHVLKGLIIKTKNKIYLPKIKVVNVFFISNEIPDDIDPYNRRGDIPDPLVLNGRFTKSRKSKCLK
ncbi:hypothetical protein A33Q_1658 [Indibacter alkaliphilus LW1]|uniref:Uncharacterized protein n=1 Tax=Indibacter alkaliphilus (strain CCUG 57479 / KCTC 22604 / LW1) TaxID=1189612 RepID=S2DFY4_INDAL|nr:hypothetical protein A33Q_1658 [Indibacter alkaliphilus LW1]